MENKFVIQYFKNNLKTGFFNKKVYDKQVILKNV